MMVRASSRNRTISCHPSTAGASGALMMTSIGPRLSSHVSAGRTRRVRVLEHLVRLYHALGFWVEVTTLVIPAVTTAEHES
jgi:hypothetical protein